MKIQVVSQYFYPEDFRVNDIVRQLVADGHEVCVLTGLPNYPEGTVKPGYRGGKNRKETLFGAQIRRAWLLGRGKSSVTLFLNYLSFAISSCWMARFMKADADIVLIMQYSPVTVAHAGYILARRAKAPSVLYCLDLWPDSICSRLDAPQDSKFFKLMVKYCRFLYNKCDALAGTSAGFADYFKNTLHVRRNMVHIPQFAEDLFEARPYLKKDGVDFVFAGNVGGMQSVETIIRAAALLSDRPGIRWHIVGAGSSLDECKKLCTELGADSVVTFHGRLPIDEMPKFYEMADAMLVTLKANEQISRTLPGKVQACMAAGRAILGAAGGETAKVIAEAECGLCAPAGTSSRSPGWPTRWRGTSKSSKSTEPTRCTITAKTSQSVYSFKGCTGFLIC